MGLDQSSLLLAALTSRRVVQEVPAIKRTPERLKGSFALQNPLLQVILSALPKIDPVLLSKSEPDEKHDFLARAKWSPSAIQGVLFPHGCKCLCSEQPAAVKGAP